jgi:hypothetical protein
MNVHRTQDPKRYEACTSFPSDQHDGARGLPSLYVASRSRTIAGFVDSSVGQVADGAKDTRAGC